MSATVAPAQPLTAQPPAPAPVADKTDPVPAKLTERAQWVVWKNENGRKIPYCPTGQFRASTTNPAHWGSYQEASAARDEHGYTGVGFVFAEHDNFVGIDLDNCRNKETGDIEGWALAIITDSNCYTEVSPSGTGVKIFAEGNLPLGSTGKRVEYHDGAVEMYHYGRYFAVTGEELQPLNVSGDGMSVNVCHAQPAIDAWFPELFGTAEDLAREEGSTEELDVPDASDFKIKRYKEHIKLMERSVSGERGSDRMIHILCEIRRMRLNAKQSWELIHWANGPGKMADPPWSEQELQRKWNDAKRMEIISSAENDFADMGEGGDEAEAAEDDGRQLKLISGLEFRKLKYKYHYHIPGVLVAKEQVIFGGMEKSLKTSIAMDMCISLAIATPFLGYFDVPKPCKVAFFSGESGGGALQRRLGVIAEDRGLGDSELLNNLYICVQSPRFANIDHLDEINRAIGELELDVCLVDPAYLSIGAEAGAHGGNNMVMGSVLDKFNTCARGTNCAMGLVHHMSKGSGRTAKKDWPKLNQLSMAGYSEWTRQWILLGRQGEMNRGKHKLKMVVGGSAGHWGQYFVNVDEGYDLSSRCSGASWDVEVIDSQESVIEQFDRLDEKERTAADKRSANEKEDDRKVLEHLIARKKAGLDPVTNNALRKPLNMGGVKLQNSTDRLLEAKQIKVEKARRRGKQVTLYSALDWSTCDAPAVAPSQSTP